MAAVMVLGLMLSLFLSIFVSIPVICSLYSVFYIDFITVYFYTPLQKSCCFSFGNNCQLLLKFHKTICCSCYVKLGLLCIFTYHCQLAISYMRTQLHRSVPCCCGISVNVYMPFRRISAATNVTLLRDIYKNKYQVSRYG